MRELHRKNKKRGVLLAADEESVAGQCIRYRLYAERRIGRVIYRLCVHSGAEVQEAMLQASMQRVVTFYRNIVKGGVTPCSLGDLVEDFALGI